MFQSFTAGGKIFWMFPTENIERVMGPILSPNHYAAFIEVVPPLAIYGSIRHRREALLYSVMAAVMYASVIACDFPCRICAYLRRVRSCNRASVASGARLRAGCLAVSGTHLPTTGCFHRCSGVGNSLGTSKHIRPFRRPSGIWKFYDAHDRRPALVWIRLGNMAHGVSCIRHHRYRYGCKPSSR